MLKILGKMKRYELSARMFKAYALGKSNFCIKLLGYDIIANVERIKNKQNMT